MAVQPVGVREIAVGKLQRFPGNARRGNVEEIRASVRRLGQYRTIVVRDTGDGLVILAGNHTADALEAEGHKKVRCEVITCDDDEARRVNLADNHLSDMAEDDDKALAELLLSARRRLRRHRLHHLRRGSPAGSPDFDPSDEDPPRLDELEPRPCPKCGYDTANDPEGLKPQ